MNRVLVAMLLSLLSAGAAAGPLPRALESLAAAERAFAADGLRDGVQKSFLAHFAADAYVLHPFAVAGPEFYRVHADKPGTRLLWAPQYLAVSAAGDLGVSSGPWRFEAEHDGRTSSAHGHFFSIWRRDAPGNWEVVFDHGISHAAADSVEKVIPVALPFAGAPAGSDADAARRRTRLIAADDALRTRLAYDPGHGYAAAARADTLWLRDGAVPMPAPAPPPPAAGTRFACGCGPREVLGLSASGDLGYTIGGRESQRDKGVYVRVWRFDVGAGWTLLADLSAAVD